MSSNVKDKDHAKPGPARPKRPSNNQGKTENGNKDNEPRPSMAPHPLAGSYGFKAPGKPLPEHDKPAAPRPKAPDAEYLKPAVKRKGKAPEC